MLKKKLKLIITFHTSSEAMATEKACKDEGIIGQLISAPRELTADCGISYAAEVGDKDRIEELLNSKKIEYDRMVEIEV